MSDRAPDGGGTAQAAAGPGRRAGWPRRLALRGAVALLLVAPAVYLLLDAYVLPGAIFLLRVSDASEAAVDKGDPWTEKEVTIPGARPIRARVYQPVGETTRTVVLVHGVHKDGIDERRLMPFARKLAGFGYAVVTPELKELMGYEIRTETVDDIERAVRWTLDESGLVRKGAGVDGKVGLMGISFGGGLSVSAAARPTIRDRLAFVFSFGGHADLRTVFNYLVSGRLPDGAEVRPHVYAVAVMLRQFAEHMVPGPQVEPLRACVYEFLAGDDADEARARARAMAEDLPDQARRLAEWCLDEDVQALGRAIKPRLEGLTVDAALSPLRQAAPACPVYLLHGSIDNVIPPSESVRLAKHIRTADGGSATSAKILVTDLVVHVELEKKDWTEMLWLARFWTDLLRE